ncbi:MAG: DUF4124 domain-containing protein [Gammaproteobacteria bacterium]|nr:DUF4124 domain-containing protein [Gammaproteobacteria bacterium]
MAKLYKCEDAEGNIIYTDEACADGKELKLPPLHTYTPIVVPPSFPTQKDASKESDTYESLSIIEPKNDQVIYDNTGTVTVGIKLVPELKTLKEHKFSIALDGKQLKTKGVTNQIKLQNLDRGSHSVQVFVVDAANSILLSSNTITFHLRRESLIDTPGPGSAPKAPQAPSVPAAPRASGL